MKNVLVKHFKSDEYCCYLVTELVCKTLFTNKSITESHYFSILPVLRNYKTRLLKGINDIHKRSNNNSSNSSLIDHSCQIKIDYGGAQICKILQLYDFFNSSTQ